VTLLQPTRILVVGSGGREHALAWKLAAEPGVNDVIVLPGSDGIAEEPRVRVAGGGPEIDPATVVDVCRSRAIELVVVGPEQPLADGLVDELHEAGIPTFGPTAAAARIESSKAFCHAVAAAAGVPMARSRTCTSLAEAMRAIEELIDAGRGFVVKEDGLAAGKGVAVYTAQDVGLARHDLESIYEREVEATILVEERLLGREASVIVVTDGRDALALPAARDHKPLLDGDAGPNTGGMGAFSPLPDLADEAVAGIVDAFHRPVLAELARRGSPFVGALYAGLMLTDGGPVLLEFNARFGDPEAQVILPRLATALGPVLRAAARGELSGAATAMGLATPLLPTTRSATVGVVLAGERYPAGRSAGQAIDGIDAARATGAVVFHAGTRQDVDGRWRTDGGRILTVVGRGRDLADARAAAERAAEEIRWPGMQRRHDIAAGLPVTEAIA
jgi:phosphoribosylamine---glycine ligase